tara:strand:- start:1276 stop:2091 length:816 start_codon:yes stop_codon:yes gene_type:complete
MGTETVKFFQHSGNCHLNKVVKAAHPRISLVVLLLVTILILASLASAEVKFSEEERKELDEIFSAGMDYAEEEQLSVYSILGLFSSKNITNPTSEGKYINGKKEGLHKEYYKNGRLKAERIFINDKLDGISKIYYKSGKSKSKLMATANFKNSKMEGTATGYYYNGRVRFYENYKNNIKNGYCKYFNEYGGIKKEENYKNGKLDGNRKLYNEDGHISDERNYKEGKREGIFWVYYPNGEYQYIDTYKNDKKINRKAYTVEGQLRFDQDYPQ